MPSFADVRVTFPVSLVANVLERWVVAVFAEEASESLAANLQRDQLASLDPFFNYGFEGGESLGARWRRGAHIGCANERGFKLPVSGMNHYGKIHGGFQYEYTNLTNIG
jgi:hypothetical protein